MHEKAATLINVSYRSALSLTPETVQRRRRLGWGTSEGKGSGYSHPRQGGCVAVPPQGGAGGAHPVTVPRFSLSPSTSFN